MPYVRFEVGDGTMVSFWNDRWSWSWSLFVNLVFCVFDKMPMPVRSWVGGWTSCQSREPYGCNLWKGTRAGCYSLWKGIRARWDSFMRAGWDSFMLNVHFEVGVQH